MSKLAIGLSFFVCLNVLLVLSGYSASELIIGKFFVIDDDNQIVSLAGSFNETIPVGPDIVSSGEGETESSSFRITDVPKTIFSMFRFILDVIFAPVIFMTVLDIPNEIKFMLLVPTIIIIFILGVNWWRGND